MRILPNLRPDWGLIGPVEQARNQPGCHNESACALEGSEKGDRVLGLASNGCQRDVIPFLEEIGPPLSQT
jgi:hypothetical protein